MVTSCQAGIWFLLSQANKLIYLRAHLYSILQQPNSIGATPILLPGVLGVVSQQGNMFMVEIKMGEVTIGQQLSVKGVDCGEKYPLTLKAGTLIKWTKP